MNIHKELEKLGPEKAQKEMRALEKEVRKHQELYYQKNTPEISDREYDLLFERLQALEKTYPDLKDPQSPTQDVGSDLDNAFEKVEHTIPVLSLNNTYSTAEAMKWAYKLSEDLQSPELEFSLEWKIDGASIVLYYEKGKLNRVVSRGTGGVGDDITNNIKTIAEVPQRVKETQNLAVRGEVFMTFPDFEQLNKEAGGKYANPRNLVSGTIKYKKSSKVKERPLRVTVYDAYFEKDSFKTHQEIIESLSSWGLPTSEDIDFVSLKELEQRIEAKKKRRESLVYPTDGLVLKLNSIEARQQLGHTRSSPRFAVALKLEMEEVATQIEAIELFVGRTGKITPRARVTPVEIAGTTVTYATLHNENYIQELGVALGATVLISKRGEIIPAVEKVVFKGENDVFRFPSDCPSCHTPLEKPQGFVDHFCPSPHCPEKQIARLQFFAQRKQMDIEGLSDTTIETLYSLGYLRKIPDFYQLANQQKELEGLKGFGKKSVALILKGVEESKKQPFRRVLPSLGLKEIGHSVTELLIEAGYRSIDALILLAQSPDLEERLLEKKEIPGIGPKTVYALQEHFKDPETLQLFETLKTLGLSFDTPPQPPPHSPTFSPWRGLKVRGRTVSQSTPYSRNS
jgi:DNA ligase (NAD+)